MLIDTDLLDAVSSAAKASPRLRKHHNFHLGDTAVCHRLLNAIEPYSYVPVHRHLDVAKEESLLILRGRLGVVFFDQNGNVQARWLLAPGSDTLGVNIPVGQFHSVLALAADTVFFETKAGPYLALSHEERAPFSPAENTPEAADYYRLLMALFT